MNVEIAAASKVGLPWLRDNCRCNKCYNSVTFERKITVLDIPDNLSIDSYSALDDKIAVKWNDGHYSEYSIDFLMKYNFENYTTNSKLIEPYYWNANNVEGKPAYVDFGSYMGDNGTAKTLMKSLVKYGIGFVTNVPATVQHTKFTTERLFPVLKTFFGGMWIVTDSNEHPDSAYSKSYLGPHNDLTFFHDLAGVQVLHCIVHDGLHGETFMIDGFQVAENIRKKHPETFKRLCTVPYPVEYIEDGIYYRHDAPVITLDPITQDYVKFRYNTANQAPIDTIPMEQMDQYYADLKILTKEIESKSNQWWFKLSPGTVMIFDNWRLLHGRNHYTGKRQLSGCHIARRDFTSLARTMGLIR